MKTWRGAIDAKRGSVSRTFRAKSPEHRRFFRNFISSLHVRTTRRAAPVAEQQFPLHIQGPKRSVVASSRKVITADILRANEMGRGTVGEKCERAKRKEKSSCGGLIFSRFFTVFYALFTRLDELYQTVTNYNVPRLFGGEGKGDWFAKLFYARCLNDYLDAGVREKHRQLIKISVFCRNKQM